jgi:hypothetical protein
LIINLNARNYRIISNTREFCVGHSDCLDSLWTLQFASVALIRCHRLVNQSVLQHCYLPMLSGDLSFILFQLLLSRVSFALRLRLFWRIFGISLGLDEQISLSVGMLIKPSKNKLVHVLRKKRLLCEGGFMHCAAVKLIRLNYSLLWNGNAFSHLVFVAYVVGLIAQEILILISLCLKRWWVFINFKVLALAFNYTGVNSDFSVIQPVFRLQVFAAKSWAEMGSLKLSLRLLIYMQMILLVRIERWKLVH